MPNRSDLEVAGCAADRPFRWGWDQQLKNNGSVAITLTERINYMDNAQFSRVGNFTITIQPGQTHDQNTRVCSSVAGEHNFRTDWTGSDGNGARVSATGPTVRLLAR